MRSRKDRFKYNNYKKTQSKNVKRRPRRNFEDLTSVGPDGCLLPRFCKGKHVPVTQDKTLLENADKLFKNQRIKLVNTVEECKEVVRELLSHCEEYNVLGLDCEFISQYYRHPVALLQLASHRGLCALIRLCHLKKIPRELQQLLEDENIIKVGIETFMDGTYLVKDYGINRVASTLDLRILAEQCDFRPLGLGKLTEEHLKVQLNKNPCVNASGWEDNTLKNIRVEYAAKDVHVSVELFKIFAEKLKPKPTDADGKKYLQDFIKEHCAQHLNIKWKPAKKPNPDNTGIDQKKEQCPQQSNVSLASSAKKPISKPDPFRYQTIRIIKTDKDCRAVMQELKSHCDEFNVLGIKFLRADVGSGRERMDLLQLATHRGLCAIIYLNYFRYIPTELQQILYNRAILKVGVDPLCNKSKNIYISSTLELNFLLSVYQKKPNWLAMNNLCKWFLRVKLEKNPSKKLGNIENNFTKNEAQIAIEIFKEFIEKLEFERNDNDQKKNLDAFIERYCRQFLDKKY